jgi:proteasome assembly chaperone 2
MSLYVPEGEEVCSFAEKTVILGIPSVGNVGQLALDFLISSFAARRVGFIDSANVLPVVGNDPYHDDKIHNKTGELHTSAEVYDVPNVSDVILVIVRAPITNARSFSQEVVQWLIAARVKSLVVLSSANASWRMDNLIRNECVSKQLAIH